jgi:hypothetical protein
MIKRVGLIFSFTVLLSKSHLVSLNSIYYTVYMNIKLKFNFQSKLNFLAMYIFVVQKYNTPFMFTLYNKQLTSVT